MTCVFKKGDKVVREKGVHAGMFKGDIDEVVSLSYNNEWVEEIELKKYGTGHNPANFRLAKNNNPDHVHSLVENVYPNPPHVHRDVIKAWADGANIEMKNQFTGVWKELRDPRWLTAFEYRVVSSRKLELKAKIKALQEELEELEEE